MEVGHLMVAENGPLCGCGLHGCLEAVASRLAVSAAAATAVVRGKAPFLQENYGSDISNIRSGALAAAVEAGDQAVEIIVRDAARWLGIGVAHMVNLLLPDVLVLGGGMVEALPDIYMTEVKKSAEKNIFPDFVGCVNFKIAKLGDDAVAYGAAVSAKSLAQG